MLLDSQQVSAPDVPPRNPTMNRINGRIPNDLDMDCEPSCLVRTPSGNIYIPSGNISKFCSLPRPPRHHQPSSSANENV